MDKPLANLNYDSDEKRYICEGNWAIQMVSELQSSLIPSTLPRATSLTISGKDLLHFDSAGALCLFNFITDLRKNENQVELIDFNEQQQALLSIIEEKQADLKYIPSPPEKHSLLYNLGKETITKLGQAQGLTAMIGDIAYKLLSAIHHIKRLHVPSIIATVYNTGVTALPIVALLSFLIGVVLSYQMGLQLETYGANIFIAYISGMAIFREFSPLITAIIVAGRTSSAFTAQIGSMKINEEIDALYTMGLSPTELLVIPRVIGLLIVFPLLIFWSVFFATLGAMFMSKAMLDVGYFDFLSRLQDSVGIKQLLLGLYKAPAFAILIAIVGCYQGMLVQASADSVGRQTTKSVVQALFLIIVADAVYSIIYSWLGI